MTTTAAAAGWKEIAAEEHLLEGITGKRLDMVELLLMQLPDDQVRLIFLRWCSEMGIQSDSSLVIQTLMIMTTTTRIVEQRLQAAYGNVKEAVSDVAGTVNQVEKASEQVAETLMSVLNISHGLKSSAEKVTGQMGAVVTAMVERAEKVIDGLDAKLTEIATAKVDTAVQNATEAALTDRLAKTVTALEALDKGAGAIAQHLRELAGKWKDIKANDDIVILGQKIDKTVAKYAAIVGAICLVVGMTFGHFVLPQPKTVTFTTEMQTLFNQGAAFQKWYAKASPSERSSVDQVFQENAQASANATPSP